MPSDVVRVIYRKYDGIAPTATTRPAGSPRTTSAPGSA